MSAIEVVNLRKLYPQAKRYRELILHPFERKTVTALDGMSLHVEEGRCFFLLGPNGAGKTTLIKVLATLMLPDEGSARVCGFDVVKEPNRIKKVIGISLNEERSFYWRLTGRQNLEFFAALSGIHKNRQKEKVEQNLKLTGLVGAADSRFNTYSTGMKQMLSLARALIIDARVLFVDEPTRSLDPRAAQKIRRFIREELVNKQRRTVFWATHNLAEVEEFGQDVAIIDKGRIRFKGSVRSVLDQGKKLQSVFDEVIEPEVRVEEPLDI